MKLIYSMNKLKKHLILFLTLILLMMVWNFMIREKPWEIDLSNVMKERPDVELKDIVAKQISGKKTYWKFNSPRAILQGNKSTFMDVDGELFDSRNKVVFTFTSPEISLGNNKTILNQLRGLTTDKTEVYLRKAFWFQEPQYLYSPSQVKLKKEKYIIHSNKFYFFPTTKKVSLKEGVLLTDLGKTITVNAKECEIYESDVYLKSNINMLYEEIRISGNSMKIVKGKRDIEFTDQVTINYQQAQIVAGELKTKLNDKELFLSEGVIVTKGENYLESDQAIIQRDKNMVLLKGNVKGSQYGTNITSAEVRYNLKTNKIETTGRSKLIKVMD